MYGPGEKARLGCGAVVVVLLLATLVAGFSGDDDQQPSQPVPTAPAIPDPGYTDSLCEGSDYVYYDGCR